MSWDWSDPRTLVAGPPVVAGGFGRWTRLPGGDMRRNYFPVWWPRQSLAV